MIEVTCPDDIKAEVGAPVSCTALNPAETKLELEGKVTKVDGNKARFEVKAIGGVADSKVAVKVAQQPKSGG